MNESLFKFLLITLKYSIIIATICSFFILIDVIIFKNKNHRSFSNWEFPMILALLLDIIVQ